MKKLAIIFALLLCAFTVNIPAADIYVDNDDGFPGYVESGTWVETGNTTLGYNGGSYRVGYANNPVSTATWIPDLPETTDYDVYAVFRRNTDRSTTVPYTVNYAGGSTTINISQKGSSALVETYLGTFPFNAGDSGSVVLTTIPGPSTAPYISDAVRFTYVAKPVVSNSRHTPLYPAGGQAFTALARVSSETPLQSVSVHWTESVSANSGDADAFDDGAHNDGAALDGLYGATLPAFSAGDEVTFSFTATDSDGQIATGTNQIVAIGYAAVYSVKINEVVSSNSGAHFDLDFGDSGDWVELYNEGPDSADLSGYTLSDSEDTPLKWAFPAGISIPANQFLIVWCDDANLEGFELHTNFKLSSSGESVVLYNSATSTTIDQVDFPALATDESFARNPDGSGAFQPTILTTPNATNEFGSRGASPTFSQPSGIYSSAINVTISAPGATEVRYTLDGSEPSGLSTLYTTPIAISTTKGLRAKAYYAALAPSITASASYLYLSVADRTIPVMNLIIDPYDLNDPATGLFSNFNEHGDNWEKAAYATFMDPDGTNVHESGVGVRINGGTSRGAAKKSLRLYTRTTYGNSSWTLPWLAKTTAPSFTNLVLRANNNDGILNGTSAQLNQVTFFRDQLMRDLSGESGATGVDGFFFALYINGQYWGLYNACERITDAYMSAKAGGTDWDIVKGTWDSTVKYHMEPIDGDLIEWNNFMTWFNTAAVDTPAGLDALKQRFDYSGFLKYFALNIGVSNQDWPQNNFVMTRRRGDVTAKWTPHENDAEWALGLRPQGFNDDTIVWAQGANFMISAGHNHMIAPLSKIFNGSDLDPNGGPLIPGILDNPQGLKDFISAVEETFNFELEPTHAIGEVNAYATAIQTEVPRESTRWAVNPSAFTANWPTAVQTMRTYLTNRPGVVRSQMLSKFSIAGLRKITFNKSGGGDGKMVIYGRTVTLPWSGIFFDSSMLHLSAIPANGSQFSGWNDGIIATDLDVDHAVTTGADMTVTLTFDPLATDIQPNDVIFNEYWVNDAGTTYDTVGGGAITGDWVELLTTVDGLDLRGWRVTNNATKIQQSSVDGSGSLIFPDLPVLASVPANTIILLVNEVSPTNTATFPADDLDSSDNRLIFYVGNGNLDVTTDPGFTVGTSNEALVLLAPGPSASFSDDIGVDFIAEGATVTPATFFADPLTNVIFTNPFSGIGGDDGAIFISTTANGFNNDNGAAGTGIDPGPGGWIVDPSSAFSGDAVGSQNILTPGGPNTFTIVTPTPTPSPSPTVSATPTETPLPTDSPTPSVTATAVPTATASPSPSETPTVTPSETISPTPSPTPLNVDLWRIN